MRYCTKSFLLAHFIFFLLVVSLFLPGEKKVEAPWSFLAAILLMEAFFLFRMARKKNRLPSNGDLAALLYFGLLLWEVLTSKMNLLHPVLCPAPENVFHVFSTQYKVLLGGVVSSMELLILGFGLGISLGVLLGLVAGWVPRLRQSCFPIAQVLTPIPPVIYAPYLIALMPTFRSASFLVVFLGIFWPTFLNIILRVGSVEKRLIDSARTLNVNDTTMIRHILFPYVLPGVVSGLRVTTTTAFMMLTFAEMMGATSGMGYYIINYTHYANYTNVVAGIILVGIVVTIINWIVGLVQERAIKWR